MLHCILQLHRNNFPMFSLNMINPLSLLSTFYTSSSRFMMYWRNLMPNTNNGMISIRCLISFRWVRKFAYIYKRSTSLEPITRFNHSDIGLTPSPKLWETMLSSSVSPHSLLAPYIEWGLTLAILSTIVGHIRHCWVVNTNRAQSRLHWVGHHWLYHRHTYQ